MRLPSVPLEDLHEYLSLSIDGGDIVRVDQQALAAAWGIRSDHMCRLLGRMCQRRMLERLTRRQGRIHKAYRVLPRSSWLPQPGAAADEDGGDQPGEDGQDDGDGGSGLAHDGFAHRLGA